MSMPMFQYKAASNSGDVVQGEMEAASQEAVIRHLQDQGHIPIRAEEITRAAPADDAPAFSLHRRRPGRADVNLFTIELATLLRAGLPLDKALEMLVNIAERAPFRGRAALLALLPQYGQGG
jgi:general secretion pathway protein F